MVGFRAAGWMLCAAAASSIIIGLVGLRGIGIVGRVNDVTHDATVQNTEKDADSSGMPTLEEPTFEDRSLNGV
jgi:hypothetical protein